MDIDYDFEIALYPNGAGVEAQVHRKLAPGDYYYYQPVQVEKAQAHISYHSDKAEYVYEVAIPLSEIPELQERLAKAADTGDSIELPMGYMVVDGHRWDSPTRWCEETGNVELAAFGLAVAGGRGTPNFVGYTATRLQANWGFVR